LPFFGIELVLLDPVSGEVIRESNKEGVLCIAQPWPSMARTVYGDHGRFLNTYLDAYKGYYVSQSDKYHERECRSKNTFL
jgi:acetyl-CoA synthetase